MIPKLEQHQLLIVYYWNGILFLGLCCWSKEFRSAISPVEEFFCASTYLRLNTFFVYSLAAHPSYRQSSHFAYTQQSLRSGRTMCPMSDTGHLRLHTITGVHPNFVKSNQDVNAFQESFNETNNKGLSVVRLFLPSRSLEPSRQVACGGEIRWNLTC